MGVSHLWPLSCCVTWPKRRIKAWKSVCHFHFAALAMLEMERWKPETRWQHMPLGCRPFWTCYFEPQGWTSHALRQTQKFWTDLMRFLSARLVWQNFNSVSLQMYCFVGTVLWVPIIFRLHDCMSAFTSMMQVSSIKTCAMGITWLCEYCGRCNLAKTGENLSFEHAEVCCCWCLREVWFETQKLVLVERNGTGLLHER